MSEIANNLICNLIQTITLVIFIRILLMSKSKLLTIKNISSFSILNIFIFLIYDAEYKSIYTIIFFLIIVTGLFLVYKFSISKAFLVSGLFMIFLFFADIVTSSLFVTFASIEELRSTYFIYSNLCVALITILLISIKKIRKYLLILINNSEKKKNVETIFFIILLITALSLIIFMTSQNYLPGRSYTLNTISMSLFFVLTIIFFKEKYEKEKVVNKYDQLFEYVKDFEEWMEVENMNIHESKNQLATLREMVKNNKKATDYIDNIIKERIDIENTMVENLKYIPKGGLKGLLYYKISIAKSNSITFSIDISKNINKVILKLNTEETKILCRLVGIFLDNAIEAAKISKKKQISCELYLRKDDLIITISNTYNGNIELSRLNEYGYTTKGNGRGKGLYLANKMANKNKMFKLENRIINNYYVQTIVIQK